jgi:hypothetical protein
MRAVESATARFSDAVRVGKIAARSCRRGHAVPRDLAHPTESLP